MKEKRWLACVRWAICRSLFDGVMLTWYEFSGRNSLPGGEEMDSNEKKLEGSSPLCCFAKTHCHSVVWFFDPKYIN